MLERMEQYITDHNVISYSAAISAMENKKRAVTVGAGLVFRYVTEHSRIQTSLATDLRSELAEKTDGGSWLCTFQERYNRERSTPMSSATILPSALARRAGSGCQRCTRSERCSRATATLMLSATSQRSVLAKKDSGGISNVPTYSVAISFCGKNTSSRLQWVLDLLSDMWQHGVELRCRLLRCIDRRLQKTKKPTAGATVRPARSHTGENFRPSCHQLQCPHQHL